MGTRTLGSDGSTYSQTCCGGAHRSAGKSGVTALLGELSRPRYFSGQYLSDEELSLEQDYLREKLRRHNLHLHGTGVVCGLDVTCGLRDGYVTLGGGYAIDGCGNDIYVPRPLAYNLQANLPREHGDDCPEPFLVLRAGLSYRHDAGGTVVRMTEAPGAAIAVDPDRRVPVCGSELPVDDATAATLAAGQVIRLGDLDNQSWVQYVTVAANGQRTIHGAFQFPFDSLTLQMRAVTLTAAAGDPARSLVNPAYAGAATLTLDDYDRIRPGDVLRVTGDRSGQDELVIAATAGPAISTDTTCQVYLYLQYREERDALRRSVPAGACTGAGHCEPSRVREGFTLRVSGTDERTVTPDLVDTIQQRVRDMLEQSGIVRISGEVAKIVEDGDTWDGVVHEQLVGKFNELKSGVLGASGGLTDCQAQEALRAQHFPNLPAGDDREAYVEGVLDAFAAVYGYAVDTLWDSACQALLIDCPSCAAAGASDVLLARISVRDGKVVDICNHPRRHVKTFPALEYWLSPLSRALAAPFNAILGARDGERGDLRGPSDIVEFMCCEFDFGKISRSLAQRLLPELKVNPTPARPFVSGARKMVNRVKAVPAEVRAKRDELRVQATEKRPQIIQRVRTIAKIQDMEPIAATNVVREETGLPVTGTVIVERRNLASVSSLGDVARALWTDKPVEVAMTRDGAAFLRTRPARVSGPGETLSTEPVEHVTLDSEGDVDPEDVSLESRDPAELQAEIERLRAELRDLRNQAGGIEDDVTIMDGE